MPFSSAYARRRFPLCATGALACVLLLSSCRDEAKLSPEKRATELTYLAEEKLAAAKLGEARNAFQEIVSLRPDDSQAALGLALTDLLLLPDSPPVAELLSICGEKPFDMERNIFGPDGLLAEFARRTGGTSEVGLYLRHTSESTFEQVPFAPELSANRGNSSLTVSVDAEDPSGEPIYVSVYLNPADVYPGTDVEPLHDGMLVDISRLSHGVRLYSPDFSRRTVSGNLRFQGGSNEGDAFSLEFVDVRITGVVSPEASAAAQFREYRLHGTIRSTLFGNEFASAKRLPFYYEEPQYRQSDEYVSDFTRIVTRCSQKLSTDFLTEKGRELADRLDAIASQLDTALAAGPGMATFRLPGAIFASAEDLPLNSTDIYALRAGVRAGAAGLRLLGSYRYLDGPLHALLLEGHTCYDGPRVALRPDPRLMLENLARTFLTQVSGTDDAAIKRGLMLALTDAAMALRNRPSTKGIFDFQASGASLHSEYLAQLLDTARASLESDQPMVVPSNPSYRVHLRKVFEPKLDRTLLLERTGLASLFELATEDGWMDCKEDYVSIVLPMALDAIERWTGGAVQGPPPPNGLTCSSAAPCPAPYVCEGAAAVSGGQCALPPLRSMTTRGWRFNAVQAPRTVVPALQRVLRGI